MHLRRQVAWFQRQIFGQKSEQRLPEPDGVQGTLGESFAAIPEGVPPNKKTRAAGHERESKSNPPTDGADESSLFFDEQKAPVEIIPDVAIDTNHLERALRVIPMGRKNWLFSWTELGAKHVGIVQSLLVTCRLHDIDPYDYFVDVLQRVGQHPASQVDQLTPRLWKPLFAANPLRSDLYGLGK